jgi:hypothetical protein
LVLGLVLAAPAAVHGQSVLRGVVIDARGNPVPQAQVLIEKLSLSATVGTAGDFAFTTIPHGKFTVLTRAVGFEPDLRDLSFNGRDSMLVEIRLKPSVQRLEPLVAKADAPKVMSPQMRALEERRKAGFGRFIMRDELAKREHSTLGDVLRMVSGAKLVRRPWECGDGFVLATTRGGEVTWQPWMTCHGHALPAACYLTVYLDGARIWTWGEIEPPNVDELSVSSFEAIELYRGAAELPIEFQTTGSACGAILLWTRTGESN